MSTAAKMITLRSSDKENFEVDEKVLMQSQTIKHMIEDDCADNIPLPNVTSKILAKIIEYCKKHVESDQDKEKNPSSSSSSDADGKEKNPSSSSKTADDSLKTWDAEFVKVDQSTLFELIVAANYLDIKSLLDLTCQTVANMIPGKAPEEVREMFNIKNDFIPEEEDQVRKENKWAFE